MEETSPVGGARRGGEIDRTVEVVRRMERTLAAIDTALQQVGWVSRLLLLYKGTRQSYEWRLRGSGRFATYVGSRVPQPLLRRLRPQTRQRVLGIEKLLDARAAGRTVVHLLEDIIARAETWRDRTVTLQWHNQEVGRLTWTFPLGGGLLGEPLDRRIMVRVESYMSVVKPYVGRGGGGTPLSAAFERWLGSEVALHTELATVAERLRACEVRLYRDASRKSWAFRLMRRRKPSVALAGGVLKHVDRLPAREREVIERAVANLGRLQRVRRGALLIGRIAEIAEWWCDGDWRLCGEDVKVGQVVVERRGSNWVWVAKNGSVLKRRYHDILSEVFL